ncbi:MAG: hypothetical protein N2557_08055, partial [Hydrogenophilus sp.]|nr:hypothetical protein [Hydrogenophilus sp.]
TAAGVATGTYTNPPGATLPTTNTTASTTTGPSASALAAAHSRTIPGLDALPSPTDPLIAPLLSGQRWAQTALTFGFPTQMPSSYTLDPALKTDWRPMTLDQRGIATELLRTAVAPLALDLTLASDPALADIRLSLARTSNDPNTLETGVAAHPGPDVGGDIVLNHTRVLPLPEQLPRFKATLLHELGHALGLKHPFEGAPTLPSAYDNGHWTIMTYTHEAAYEPGINWSYQATATGYQLSAQRTLQPTLRRTESWGLLDLAALMALYGPDPTHNAGNTTHRLDPWGPDTWAYLTLFDAGGTDTLDLTAITRPSRLDLRPGTLSSIGLRTKEQLAEQLTQSGLQFFAQHGRTQSEVLSFVTQQVQNLFTMTGADRIYYGEKNLAIAYGTIIENAHLGPADDQIWDNAVNNYLRLGAGNDQIYLGAGGFDTIDGGPGTDTLILPGKSTDHQLQPQPDQTYLLIGPTYAALLIGIEKLQFTDKLLVI